MLVTVYYSLVESPEDVVTLFANLKLVHVGRDDAPERVPRNKELEAGWTGSSVKISSSLGPEPLGGSVKV